MALSTVLKKLILVVQILMKRFRNDGPYLTKAAVRKTRSTVKKMKAVCNLYDDFYPSMQFLELAYKQKNVLRTDDSNIYLYNTINGDSQTKKFFSDKKKIEEEEKIFRKSIKKNKNFNLIKDWDLSKIEMKSIDFDPSFLFRDKYIFTTNLVANLNIDNYLHEDILIYDELVKYIVNNNLQKNYQFFIDYYNEKSQKLVEFLNS